MALYGYNDWRYYQGATLQHNWGTSPKMKAKEKEYNAKYYQEHRDEILANARKKNDSQEKFDDQEGYKFRGREIRSEDDLHKRASEEEDELARLIEENEKIGGYPPDVMENIKKHNEMVKENIEKLTATVNDYIKSHPNISQDEIDALADSVTKQVDRAHTQMIDLSSDSGKKYVDELMKKKNSSGSSSSKSKGSSSASSSSSGNKSNSRSNTSSSPISQQKKKYSPANPNFATGSSTYTSTRSNMPESASDLATIERERQRAQQRGR